MFPDPQKHPIIFEEAYTKGSKKDVLQEELITHVNLIE